MQPHQIILELPLPASFSKKPLQIKFSPETDEYKYRRNSEMKILALITKGLLSVLESTGRTFERKIGSIHNLQIDIHVAPTRVTALLSEDIGRSPLISLYHMDLPILLEALVQTESPVSSGQVHINNAGASNPRPLEVYSPESAEAQVIYKDIMYIVNYIVSGGYTGIC